MLSSSDVDAVYLATPIGLHFAQGKAVLSAGKHLWCEKSLTTRSEHTQELIALSRDKDRSLCEAVMFAYHPQFRRLVELVVLERALGRVASITSRFSMPFLENPRFRHSPELGGGALFDLACYPIALALRLTGEGAPRVLAARLERDDRLSIDVSGHALLQSASGTLAYCDWGFGVAYANEATIWGEVGSLHVDRAFSKQESFEAAVHLADARGARHIERFAATNSFVEMFAVFARAATDEGLRERLRYEASLQAACLETLRLM